MAWEEPPDDAIPEPTKRKVGRPRKDQNAKEKKLQESAKKRLRATDADLEPIIDQMVRMIQWHQNTLENEMTSGMARRQKYVTEEDMDKIVALSKMVKDLGDLKLRWLAAAQKYGAALTPKQVLEGAISRIMAEPSDIRGKLIKRLVDEHRALNPPWAFKIAADTDGSDPNQMLGVNKGSDVVPLAPDKPEEAPKKGPTAVDILATVVVPVSKEPDAGS